MEYTYVARISITSVSMKYRMPAISAWFEARGLLSSRSMGAVARDSDRCIGKDAITARNNQSGTSKDAFSWLNLDMDPNGLHWQ